MPFLEVYFLSNCTHPHFFGSSLVEQNNKHQICFSATKIPPQACFMRLEFLARPLSRYLLLLMLLGVFLWTEREGWI